MTKRTVEWFTATLCLGLLALSLAAKAPPTKASSALEQGWKAYSSGLYREALDLAKTARRESPGDPSVLELWGRANLAMGHPVTAVGALTLLAKRRGKAEDYRLLSLADAMAGRKGAARKALDKAETAKEPSLSSLYALAYSKSSTGERAVLLKRATKAYPDQASSLAAEASFWEALGDRPLRSPEKPLPAGGVAVPMKTLYNMDWALCKTKEGKELWLMVDTASRRTILSEETARRMGLKTAPAALPAPGAYPGESAPTLAFLDRLEVGEYRLRNVPVQVVKDNPGLLKYREGRVALKGILGMDLLRGKKVRFDRRRNLLTIMPPSASKEALLGGPAEGWSETPAFAVGDQVLVPVSIGKKGPILGLLDTGCTLVMACAGALEGSGLSSSSRNTTDLTPGANFKMPSQAADTPNAEMERMRSFVLGWLDEAMPMPGRVRTVPRGATVGFASATFQVPDLPVYPSALGGDVPVGAVVGKKITDFYSVALDLHGQKAYVKQVLFK